MDSEKPQLKMQKKSTISGYRVQLSKITFDHVPHIYNLLQTPGVLDYLTLKTPSSTEEIRQYVIFLQNQWIMNSDYTYMIEAIKQTPENRDIIPVGQISLYDLNFVHRRAEVGIWLGSPYWKKGYATEALQLMIHYAFEDMQFNRIQAHIFLENFSSQKLFERIGFKKEGTNRQYVMKDTTPCDVFAYALLKSEWLGFKKI
jgi:RimJ/RimL family protein N-acetyltransferase